MTRTVVHPAIVANAALHCRRFAARAGRSLCAAILARATRRALNELPDDLLREIGLVRSDIRFVADAVACGDRNRDARDWPGGSAVDRSAAARRLLTSFVKKMVAPEAAAVASPMPK